MSMSPLIGLVCAYLLGSIPFAYLAGKLVRGIDLREHGSGNLGATNVYRVLGWRVALVVFAADVAKGAVPVLIFPRWLHTPFALQWAIAFGVAAILGHLRSVFLLWRGGGKGVATAAGVFLALAPLATVGAAIVWGVVLYVFGYVSLASLAAAVALPVGTALAAGPTSLVFVVSALVGLLVIWMHRANIARLWHGQEHRVIRTRKAG